MKCFLDKFEKNLTKVLLIKFICNRDLTPTNLCIGDVTLMDKCTVTSEGIKTDPSRYGIEYTIIQIKHYFEIMSFHFTDAAKCLH